MEVRHAVGVMGGVCVPPMLRRVQQSARADGMRVAFGRPFLHHSIQVAVR
jgi:hypothetical protein